MSSGTLYTYPDNFRAQKVLIAAQYSKIAVKVAKDFVFGETNKSASFLKKFPLGKVPAFETDDGQYLTESNAIAHYVANDQLKGKSKLDQAQILQWVNFAEGEILPAASAWLFPIIGILPFNKQTAERAKEDIKKVLSVINDHLLTRTYLVGERITLADITMALTLVELYKQVLDTQFRKPYVNANRWFNTIVNQKEVKSVIGEVQLAVKAAEFDPKKLAEFQGKKAGGPAKGGKAPQKPDAPKEGGKKDAKKKEADEDEKDETDEILAAEPKSKDPFEQFPKSDTFNFDEFKRCYSNEDETKSIPFFWEKFDPKTYSIWFCEYKYNNELEKVFMSCNLITGMFQRIDKLRKNAFASMCLFGTDNNSTISGVWVWKSHELAFTLSPDWQVDYEVYDWKKLDPNNEATKKLVQQYFSWTGTDKDGRAFNQGKIFK